MNKEQVKEFYGAYKDQILAEMQEYLDMPLENLTKQSDYAYAVYGDGIAANIAFRKNFYDNPSLNKYFNLETAKNTYSLDWRWNSGMDPDLRKSSNFLRVLASMYQVVSDFLESKHPDVISFSGLTKGHDSLYFGTTFQKRLKTLVGNEYDVVLEPDQSVVYLVNKVVSNVKSESIKKRATETSLSEAIAYWKYPHLHPSTSSNVKAKQLIKRRVLESLYFKSLKS